MENKQSDEIKTYTINMPLIEENIIEPRINDAVAPVDYLNIDDKFYKKDKPFERVIGWVNL